MSTNCREESAVARSVRSGEWSEALRAHLRQCPACRSVQQSAEWMQALAASSDGVAAQNDLPDPQILWLRAQLSERQAAAERLHLTLQLVELACAMIICVGLGVWLAWNWGEVGGAIANGLDWTLFEAWPTLWNDVYAYGPANAPVLFSSGLAVLSLIAVAVAYPLVARE